MFNPNFPTIIAAALMRCGLLFAFKLCSSIISNSLDIKPVKNMMLIHQI